MTAPSRIHSTPAPELIECPDCGGYGTVACCYAWEVEGVGGPRGCRCAHPGMQPCDACDGTGVVEPDDEEDR